MKRRFISFILILVLLLSITLPSFAIGKGVYIKEAEQLKLLGVFQGTDNGFELDREPTRLEGLIMLIRMLGKEADALALSGQPSYFKDVPTWGIGYTNYAYKNGLANGIGNNLFGSNDLLNAKSYVTFMLRVLEYDDSKGDFSYDEAPSFAYEKGIISSSDMKEIQSGKFLRDHVAKISMITLGSNLKLKSTSLLEKLVSEGTISKSIADKISKVDDQIMEVHFIDVGQADSILIKKGNQAMLIDGGNNSDGGLVVNYIKSQNISKLDYVIGTHPHEDHIGGLDDVIDSFEIGKVILPDAITTTKTFEDLIDSISKKNLSVSKAKIGNQYDLNGGVFTILWPDQKEYSNLNNHSVVVKLTNGANSFLFTGDAEVVIEGEMLAKDKTLLKSDVLKLGHHGSITSTSQDFLNAVNPSVAIITVGVNNQYGHPHQEILDRLKAKDIVSYRTDLHGNIIAISNGKTISFNTQTTKVDTSLPVLPSTPQSPIANVIISKLDKVGELVTIENKSSEDIQLKGWTLLSVAGNQEYVFQDYILKANSSATVASAGRDGDLIWAVGNVWNNSSSDPAELYDSEGNLVFRFDD